MRCQPRDDRPEKIVTLHGQRCKQQRAAPMALSGRALVAAMCAGQVGNLLPHVVVPAVMAQHLIPQWGLSASRSRPDGEFVRARLHAGGARSDGAHRPHRCSADPADRLGGKRIRDVRFRSLRGRVVVRHRDLGACRHWVRRRLHAGPEGAGRPAAARRHLTQRHAVHGDVLGRRRPLVPDRPAGRGRAWAGVRPSI